MFFFCHDSLIVIGIKDFNQKFKFLQNLVLFVTQAMRRRQLITVPSHSFPPHTNPQHQCRTNKEKVKVPKSGLKKGFRLIPIAKRVRDVFDSFCQLGVSAVIKFLHNPLHRPRLQGRPGILPLHQQTSPG